MVNKNRKTRIFSIVVSSAMCVSMMSSFAFAASDAGETDNTVPTSTTITAADNSSKAKETDSKATDTDSKAEENSSKTADKSSYTSVSEVENPNAKGTALTKEEKAAYEKDLEKAFDKAMNYLVKDLSKSELTVKVKFENEDSKAIPKTFKASILNYSQAFRNIDKMTKSSDGKTYYAPMNKTGKSCELDSSNSYSYTFKNLDAKDKYAFYINNTGNGDMSYSFKDNVLTITYKEKDKSSESSSEPTTGEKNNTEKFYTSIVWEGIDVNKVLKDPNRGLVSIQLYQDGKEYEQPILVGEGDFYSRSWSKLEAGHKYTLDVVSYPEENYTMQVLDDGRKVVFTKKEESNKTEDPTTSEDNKTPTDTTNPSNTNPTPSNPTPTDTTAKPTDTTTKPTTTNTTTPTTNNTTKPSSTTNTTKPASTTQTTTKPASNTNSNTTKTTGTTPVTTTKSSTTNTNKTNTTTTTTTKAKTTPAGDNSGYITSTVTDANGNKTVTKTPIENTDKNSTPKTGDERNVGLWGALAGLSVVSLAAGLFFGKKREEI